MRNNNSSSVSEISFMYLMAPIDFTNDQNTMREVSEASLTDQISKYASRVTLETSLPLLLCGNLVGKGLHLSRKEYIVW